MINSPHFGAKPSNQDIRQYEQSPNWYDGKFQNLEKTSMSISLSKIPGLIYKQFANRSDREPSDPIPVLPFERDNFLAPSDEVKFIWYGHSVVLLRIADKTLLIDPMLGPDASPIAPMSTKRYSTDTLNLIDEFPTIDLILLTHDHYDHLDLASIRKLKAKTRQFFVALGVKRHLVKWGINPELITEFDWWDHSEFAEKIHITFTPSRHFSGRGLTDRAKSLWGGWVFKTTNQNIWFSGDGGYGNHFREIGDKLGPFDFGFMECGQYNENWHQIHMYPEESVQAGIDAGARTIMPVHWAGFSLAPHTWTDPAERFYTEAKRKEIRATYPQLGQLNSVSDKLDEKWWTE